MPRIIPTATWEERIPPTAIWELARNSNGNPFTCDTTSFTCDTILFTCDKTSSACDITDDNCGGLRANYENPRYGKYVEDLNNTFVFDLLGNQVLGISGDNINKIKSNWS